MSQRQLDEVSEENFDEVFDGTGMVAMPGMTDAHVHLGCLFGKGREFLWWITPRC